MIEFKTFELANGLKVIVHEDKTIASVAVNILYDVGSRDEHPDKTGFAHLFEHLMFGGSKNIPLYDQALQEVGGSNNAFTSPDITNYYVTLPAENIETAFWLESDRMLSLSFDPKVLEVQRKVVIEEFKQRYLNQPYGDVWLKLRPLIYKKHPYRWATIGKEIAHIEDATMEDVQAFFFKYYRPSNAIMVVAGNITYDQVYELSDKWFGGIPKGEKNLRNLPEEPKQTEPRFLEVHEAAPSSAIYKAYNMGGKFSADYYATDLLSDVLGRGNSSRLNQMLVRKNRIFNSISAYITGAIETGLLVISGQTNEGVTLKEADEAIQEVIAGLQQEMIDAEELQKVKNQAEATLIFSEMDVLNRAMSLALFTLLGDTDHINKESDFIQAVNPEDIHRMANEVLQESNCATLYYHSQDT